MQSIAVGIAASVLSLAVGLMIVPRTTERTNFPPEPSGPPAAPAGDDFTVSTTERIVSVARETINMQYVLPVSVGVLVIASAWAYRRSRPA